MFAPLRLIYGLRPHASIGLLLTALSATFMFVLTPFAIPDIAADFGVAAGTAGLISTAQVGGFGLTNVIAGRRLAPSAGLLRTGVAILLVVDVLSAMAPSFELLSVYRFGAGVGAGLVTWVVWADSVHERRRLADVTAVGPVGAIAGAPILGALVQAGGFRLAYAVLAAVAAAVLLIPLSLSAGAVRRQRRVSPSRSNLVLLAALALFTLAGTSVYIYGAQIARDNFGIGPLAVSFAFSLNAAAGLAATRLHLPRTGPAVWIAVVGVSVFAVSTNIHPAIFYAGLAGWGFGFWQAVPKVLRMLAERSLSPDERVGDAQAGMAFGRAGGPLLGAPLASAGAFVALGASAATVLVVCALLVLGVERYRTGRFEPAAVPQVWRL